MNEKLQADLERLQALGQRTKNAAERVRLKREEIAQIEAANGNSTLARAVLVTLEEALALHCRCLAELIESVENSYLVPRGTKD